MFVNRKTFSFSDHCWSVILSDVDVLVIMVTNEYQAESVLFGDHGVVPGMSFYFSVRLMYTMKG